MRMRARYFGPNDKYYLHHLYYEDPIYRHNWPKIMEDPVNQEMWNRMSNDDRAYVLKGKGVGKVNDKKECKNV